MLTEEQKQKLREAGYAPAKIEAYERVKFGSADASAEPAPQDMASVSVLMSPEVTEGLGELLSKWPPFDKSGLLGFGKHGLEHPLYLQLAGLPLNAVLSGKWKGADRSIIENIQSYMSGWEQEQGITPDPEETFEMYLRRVIAQILHTMEEQAPQSVAA